MQFHLGGDVRRPDGDKLGELLRVVYDPSTRKVAAIMVQHAGADEREMLFPVSRVQNTDDDTVYADVTEEEIENAPSWDAPRNVAPPPDAAGVTSDTVKEPVDVPDVPPIGAATGIESIAFVPMIEQSTPIRPEHEVIDRDTQLYTSGGSEGKIVDVFTDDSSRVITSLRAESGIIFQREIEASADQISSMTSQAITLDLDRAQLEGSQSD